MEISFHRLNQLITNGKVTLAYDAAQKQAYYTRKIFDPETDELLGTKNVYLPPLAEVQDILQKTTNERQGLVAIRDFYQAQP